MTLSVLTTYVCDGINNANCTRRNYNSFPHSAQPLADQGSLIIKALRSHTHTPLGRTPLYEGSARHSKNATWQNTTFRKETSKPPAGFEPLILASERPQSHALGRAPTGIGLNNVRKSTKGQQALQYHRWGLAPCHTNQYARSPNLSQLKWLGVVWVSGLRICPVGIATLHLIRFTRL